MLEINEHKTEVITITKDAPAKEAAEVMMKRGVGCLIVTDNEGRFTGIVSERDIVSRAVAPQKDTEQTLVADIMTTQIVTCSRNTPSSEARKIMAANNIRHLPIVEDGQVVGMLSARDLMSQQLLEDRAAAEEVAALSNCLKSIDLNEVAKLVTTEVPKLFQAQRCILYLEEIGVQAKAATLESCADCLCPVDQRQNVQIVDQLGSTTEISYEAVPPQCEKLRASSPRLVIPLTVSGLKESAARASAKLCGCLCMCGLPLCSVNNKELISYKAKLAREILNSHLSNARLYQQARITSVTDALTGVGSRKLLEDKLEAECARARRYGRAFSVAIIDLDNFKTINDVLGHAVGDDALRQLASCMKAKKRIPDIVTRYGGDEFVILMPETTAENASVMLERLRSRVHEIRLAQDTPITISCGIAQSSEDCSDSSSEVMRRADIALYEAKSAGRDCVKVWNQDMVKQSSNDDVEVEKIKKLQRRIAGLSEQAESMFIQSIWGLVQALEAKEPFSAKHSEHVMRYAVGIAETMGLGPEQLEIIRRAAMIHDIGKIGVPDAILSKPAVLTPAERRTIEQHPLIAVRILNKMSFLEQEIEIIRHHHEKWNGRGYPDGLANASIPLGARIVAVADTFDALTSDRSYHQERSIAEAMDILTDSANYDFDPEVVRALSSWVAKAMKELDPEDELTLEDLLGPQDKCDDIFADDTDEQTVGAITEA